MILDKKYEKISKKAVRCWQINGAIFSAFLTAVVLIGYFVWFRHWYILPIIPVVILLNCFILPTIEFRQWQYLIESDRVEIVHGIFLVQRTVIPINRIQHLKVVQGMIQKFFDISDVTIFTAAGTQKIEALPSEKAKQIIERLNAVILSEEVEKNA